jgi:hypothetical protein
MMPSHVDGNALAGPLSEIFAVDLTGSRGRCAHCGDVAVIAQSMVYATSTGTVATCSACGGVLLTIVEDGDRTWVSLTGLSAFEIRH